MGLHAFKLVAAAERKTQKNYGYQNGVSDIVGQNQNFLTHLQDMKFKKLTNSCKSVVTWDSGWANQGHTSEFSLRRMRTTSYTPNLLELMARSHIYIYILYLHTYTRMCRCLHGHTCANPPGYLYSYAKTNTYA